MAIEEEERVYCECALSILALSRCVTAMHWPNIL